jgi:hypothetical protein
MTDETGHMNRPGAGPHSAMMSIDGIPINHYINNNPNTGLVEIVRPMPPGTMDGVVKEFTDRASAWEWAEREWRAGRLG